MLRASGGGHLVTGRLGRRAESINGDATKFADAMAKGRGSISAFHFCRNLC